MSAPCRNIAQVKLDIKQIIENLQKLNRHDVTPKDLQEFQNNTENLLKNMEESFLKNIRSKIKKRQRKRHKKKLLKLKIKKNCNTKAISELDIKTKTNREITKLPAVTRNTQNKTHLHFKGIKECQRFLQTFELLEQLHLARGQNSSETYKFLQLRQLKFIWNSLLQDKMQEQTSTEAKIQQQWNEVLFGPAEKTYFQEKPDLQDFVRKRQIWDSYIDSKYGTSIPVGWILPDSEVKEHWRSYLKPTYT